MRNPYERHLAYLRNGTPRALVPVVLNLSKVLFGGAFVIVTRPDGTHEYEDYDSDGGTQHAREAWDPFYADKPAFAVMCRADMPGAAVDYTRPPMISQQQPLARTAASVAFYTEL